AVLPPAITARVTVEEASPIGWDRYAGPDGVVLGMRTFGMSAPLDVVTRHFGFTPERVAAAAHEAMARARKPGTEARADKLPAAPKAPTKRRSTRRQNVSRKG